jgi:predicted TPR repeat methyltransferase
MLKECGDLASAHDAYAEALRLAPADADLHLQLGHLFKVAHRLGDAGAWYEAALALDPSNREAAEHAAWVRQQLGSVAGRMPVVA